MLYLDYSRPAGQWLPNEYGGRENLDRRQVPPGAERHRLQATPGVPDHRGGIDFLAGRDPADAPGRLGFGFKWNMGWMHDVLHYASLDPVYRSFHHNEMTFALMYAYSENFVLPLSHDEVVHGKRSLWQRMPGDDWNKAAGLRALFAFMWAHPGKQLLFMGGEFGQEREWAEQWSLDWHLLDQPLHRGVHSLVRDLNKVYVASPALYTADTRPRASGGSTRTTSAGTSSASCASAPTARTWRALRISPARRTRTTGSACHWPVGGANW